jgi:hypothetical protein
MSVDELKTKFPKLYREVYNLGARIFAFGKCVTIVLAKRIWNAFANLARSHSASHDVCRLPGYELVVKLVTKFSGNLTLFTLAKFRNLTTS